jgi:cytochrome c551
MPKTLLLFLSLSFVFMLTACGTESGSPVSSPSPTQNASERAEQAHTLYNNFCISCHGGNLTEVKGPNLEKVGERLSEEQIFQQIQKGGNGMPGFKVSIKEQDLRILAEWLATKK